MTRHTFAGIAALAAAVASAQTYTVTSITSSPVWSNIERVIAINAAGQVAGTYMASMGSGRAYRWTPATVNGTAGTLADLGTIGGYSASLGTGLNNLGDVVGYSAGATQSYQALLWPPAGSVQKLGGGGARNQWEGHAVNDHKDALVWVPGSGSTSLSVVVSRLINGKRKTYAIGSGTPEDINNARQVLSRYTYVGGAVNGASLWTPNANATSWTRQPISDGAGTDLNELGEACGESTSGPFLYLPTARYGYPAGTNSLWPAVLAGLPPAPNPPYTMWTRGIAWALNDHGVVIGSADGGYIWGGTFPGTERFWIWDSTNGTRLLDEMLADPGWQLTSVHGINNAGQIVGTASYLGGPDHGVLLTPQ